jgi:hypothetical protein
VFIAKGQRIALLLAAAAVVASVVMPPWKYVGYPMTIVAGYSWIWAPMGHSPCQIQPTAEDLDWVRTSPQHLPQFVRSFGCRPDQVNERPSDIAWHILAIEWASILLVAGLVVASLHRRPRDNDVPARATRLGKPAEAAESPLGGPPVSTSSAPAAGLSGVAQRVGVPLTTVIGKKTAYLAAIFFGSLATTVVAAMLLRTYGMESYAMLFAVIQGFIAIFLLLWWRHIYRSEGGTVAEVGKPLGGASPVSASSASAAGLTGVAQRLGVPLRMVIGKMAYLAAILIGCLATAGVVTMLLRTYGWKLGGVGYALIAILFGRWMRHVYRSEGGKIAALTLSTGGFALALIVLVVGRVT